jgi:hypothetical protein
MSPLAAAVSEHAAELARLELERRDTALRSLAPGDSEAVAETVLRIADELAAALVERARADGRLAAALVSIYASP